MVIILFEIPPFNVTLELKIVEADKVFVELPVCVKLPLFKFKLLYTVNCPFT